MIARSMFEVDINARYIAKDSINRSKKYIEFVNVLRKNELDAIIKHKDTSRKGWREYLQLWFKHDWENQVKEINEKYNSVKLQFEEKSIMRKEAFIPKLVREEY